MSFKRAHSTKQKQKGLKAIIYIFMRWLSWDQSSRQPAILHKAVVEDSVVNGLVYLGADIEF